MSKFVRIALMVALGVATAVCVAAAAVPDPTNSVVPTCICVAPGGEETFMVTVNDQFGNPINNVAVVLDFGSCSVVYACSGQDAGFTAAGKMVTGYTNASGQVTFTTRAGGICQTVPGDGPIRVWAGGVLIASLAKNSSPDISGNGTVGLDDLGSFAADQLPPQNLESDFSCDGIVGLADLGIFADAQLNQRWLGFCP